VKWNNKGSNMMIMDKNILILAFPGPDYLSANIKSKPVPGQQYDDIVNKSKNRQKEMMQTITS